MKLKTTLLATALLLGFTQQASALTVNATTLDLVDIALSGSGSTSTVGFTGLQDALAGTNVVFSLDARGDLDAVLEVIISTSNGTALGNLFDFAYTPNNETIVTDSVTFTSDIFNTLLAGGTSLNILLTAGPTTSWADLSAASLDFTPVPIPAALPLLASGLFAMGAFRRRRMQQQES